MEAKPPIFFCAAIVSAMLVLPLLSLLDMTAAPGGDGYQTFGSGILVMILCALLVIIFIIMGVRRAERYRWLALIAVAAYLAPLKMLLF